MVLEREDKMARLRNGPNFASMSRSYKYRIRSTLEQLSSNCNCRLITVEMSKEEGRLSFKVSCAHCAELSLPRSSQETILGRSCQMRLVRCN